MHTQPTARCPGAALLEASLVAAQSPPRSRPPQPSPPRGLGAGGNYASFETPLGRLELWLNHSTGRAHLLPTTPWHGTGVRRRQPALATTPTADVTGIPSACSYHCADRSGTAPLLCRLLPVLSPLYDPRQAWATTLEHSTAIDQDKTTIRNTLDGPPGQTQRTVRPIAIATTPTDATGQGHISSMAKIFQGR